MGDFIPWKIDKVISKGDYNYAIVPTHPNATKNGYVLEHRIVMENKLGRLLDRKEVVHHINEIKKDNCPENLELKNSKKEHSREHGFHQFKNLVKLKCPNCKSVFIKAKNKTHLEPSKNMKFTSCSPHCRGKFSSTIQYQGHTEEVNKAIFENVIEIFSVTDSYKYNFS